MMRVAATPKSKHCAHLDHLEASVSLWRDSKDAKRRPPQHVRDEAVAAVRAGVPLADVATAIGMAAWTVSRWVKIARPTAAIRELKLVEDSPSHQPAQIAGSGVASVRLPNGICLVVPVSALTSGFIGQLLAAGGLA